MSLPKEQYIALKRLGITVFYICIYFVCILNIYRVIHDLSPPCPAEPTRCISIICISLEVYFISGYKAKFSDHSVNI